MTTTQELAVIREAYEALRDIVNADDNGTPYTGTELAFANEASGKLWIILETHTRTAGGA